MLFVFLASLAAGSDVSALAISPEARPDSFFPLPGSTVPTNARFLVLDRALAVARANADGTITALDITRSSDALEPGVIEVGRLVANETLELVATCPDCSTSLSMSWLVSDTLDITAPQLADSAPLTSVGVDSNGPRRFGVVVCVPPLVVFEPAILRIDYESVRQIRPSVEGAACLLGPNEEPVDGTPFYLVVDAVDQGDTGEAQQLCFIASAVDVAGNFSVSPETCIELASEEPFEDGCSQSGTAAPCFAFALLLARARRWRRPNVRSVR